MTLARRVCGKAQSPYGMTVIPIHFEVYTAPDFDLDTEASRTWHCPDFGHRG